MRDGGREEGATERPGPRFCPRARTLSAREEQGTTGTGQREMMQRHAPLKPDRDTTVDVPSGTQP